MELREAGGRIARNHSGGHHQLYREILYLQDCGRLFEFGCTANLMCAKSMTGQQFDDCLHTRIEWQVVQGQNDNGDVYTT
eukprot:643278-Hanusia_phi.AAC.2